MELKRIRLAAGEIAYLEEGVGEPLLFLHGAIATSEAYTPLLSLLSRTYHVLAPIHPGHGASFSIPKDWKLTNIISCYREMMTEMGFAPAYLVGHSFGGTLSLLLGELLPAKHIVVMDAPGLPFDFSLIDYSQMIINEGRDFLRKSRDRGDFKEAARAAGTLVNTVFRHPDNIPTVVRSGPKYNITGNLRRITTPVDIFWGAEDLIVPVAIGRDMETFIPTAHLTVYSGRGHNYPVTEPLFTYSEIQRVLCAKSATKP